MWPSLRKYRSFTKSFVKLFQLLGMISSTAVKITTSLKLEAKHRGKANRQSDRCNFYDSKVQSLQENLKFLGFQHRHLLIAVGCIGSFESLESMRVYLQLIIVFQEDKRGWFSTLQYQETASASSIQWFTTEKDIQSRCFVIHTSSERVLLFHHCLAGFGIGKGLTYDLIISTNLSGRESCGEGIPSQSTNTR